MHRMLKFWYNAVDMVNEKVRSQQNAIKSELSYHKKKVFEAW
jgi:hypothetical protein